MLTREAIEEALPLAQSFAERSLVLGAREDSPLAGLILQTIVLPGENGQIDIEGTLSSTNAIDPAQDGSSHDVVMDELVSTLSKVVLNHVAYAKNTVVPAVTQYINQVRQDMKYVPEQEISQYEVRTYNLPEPMQTAVLYNSLMNHRDIGLAQQPLRLDVNLPDLTNEGLLELVQTGQLELDQAVRNMLDKEGVHQLRQVYECIFQIKQETGAEWASTRTLFDYFKKDRTLVKTTLIYVLAEKLRESPISGVDMPLEDYTKFMYDLYNRAGSYLVSQLQQFSDACERDVLVREYIGDRVVVVNEPVYMRIADTAGVTEALLGSIISDTSIHTVDQLITNQEKLIEQWSKFGQQQAKNAVGDSFTHFKKVLSDNMHLLIESSDVLQSDESEKSVARKIFKGELDMVNVAQTSDLNRLALRLVCRTLFYKTDAERILLSIHENSIKNPSISPREAALIAAIELMVDWVCGQVQVQSVQTQPSLEDSLYEYWFKRPSFARS